MRGFICGVLRAGVGGVVLATSATAQTNSVQAHRTTLAETITSRDLATIRDIEELTAPSPRMLVEMADYSGLTPSPDGRFVAFRVERGSVQENRYTSRWWVVPVDGSSPPWDVGDGGEPLRLSGWPLNERAAWSEDQQWIYYRAVHAGAVQVWRARYRGGEAVQVTDDAADVEFLDRKSVV